LQGKELQVARRRKGRYPNEFRRMAGERLKRCENQWRLGMGKLDLVGQIELGRELKPFPNSYLACSNPLREQLSRKLLGYPLQMIL
jgi:hypothetical protein